MKKSLTMLFIVSMSITACSVAPKVDNPLVQQGLDEAIKQLGDVSALSRYTLSKESVQTNSDGSLLSRKQSSYLFIDSITDPKIFKLAVLDVATGSVDTNYDGIIDTTLDNELINSAVQTATLAKITVAGTFVNQDSTAFDTADGDFVTLQLILSKFNLPARVGGTGEWKDIPDSSSGIGTNFVKVEDSKLTIYSTSQGASSTETKIGDFRVFIKQ